MQLVLSLEDKVLERVDIEPVLAKNDSYLTALQNAMLKKHRQRLLAPRRRYFFYLEAASQTVLASLE